MNEWLRSTSVRLSLAFATLVSVAFLLAGAFIWRSANNAADAQIRQQIELEINAIEHELDAEGLDAALAAIESRVERPGAFEYWVTDSSGRRIFGDLRALDGPNGWRKIDLDSADLGAKGASDLLVLTRSLPSGIRISVGEDLARSAAIQSQILRTMAIIGGLTVLVCLFAGAIISKSALAKIRTLNQIMTEAANGDLGVRYVASSAAGRTDIDDIGGTINDMLRRIEQLIDNTKRVTRDVAHDLRTPLSHLRQRLEEIATEQDEGARQRAVTSAQEKIDGIIRTFDATLRLAEIDAGSAKKRFTDVDPAALVERVAEAYLPDIEASGRRLTMGKIDHGVIFGDRDLLTQAFANLVENALRHTPEGAEIELSVERHDKSLALTVADNGAGVPEMDYNRMLEPFTRLDESRTTTGAGLGLSIVAAIARQHDAKLVLKDAKPGLCVSIHLKEKF
jgi:signal transduction histidine kinase